MCTTVEKQAKKIVIGTMTVHVENRNCSSVWFPAQFSYRVYWTPFLDHFSGPRTKIMTSGGTFFGEKIHTHTPFEFFMCRCEMSCTSILQ